MHTFYDFPLYNNHTDLIFILVNKQINKYVIISQDYYKLLINNVYSNNLLILFALSFFTTLYCFNRKNKIKKHKYKVLQQEPIYGEIVH